MQDMSSVTLRAPKKRVPDKKSAAAGLPRKLVEFFERNRAKWLKHHKGVWVVVGEDEAVSFHDDFSEAAYAANNRYGKKPFLLKELLAVDRIQSAFRLHRQS